MILPQNVYTIMYMYVDEESLCLLKDGWTVVLFQLDSFLVQMGILLITLSEEDFQMLRLAQFYMLIETERQFCLDIEENFVVGDSRVWRCIGKANVKDVYACLVASDDTPKCVDRWSKTLHVVTDTKINF